MPLLLASEKHLCFSSRPCSLRITAYTLFLRSVCEWIELKLRRKFSPKSHLSVGRTDAEDAVIVRGRTATTIAIAGEHPE
jgi:hypothetical protein